MQGCQYLTDALMGVMYDIMEEAVAFTITSIVKAQILAAEAIMTAMPLVLQPHTESLKPPGAYGPVATDGRKGFPPPPDG